MCQKSKVFRACTLPYLMRCGIYRLASISVIHTSHTRATETPSVFLAAAASPKEKKQNHSISQKRPYLPVEYNLQSRSYRSLAERCADIEWLLFLSFSFVFLLSFGLLSSSLLFPPFKSSLVFTPRCLKLASLRLLAIPPDSFLQVVEPAIP